MSKSNPRHVFPVLLSGGQGTRLWPLSRKSMPKQFLPLVGEDSLFLQTMSRLQGSPHLANPIVVGSADHRFLIRKQLSAFGRSATAVILEPVARNTAVAAALAAVEILTRDPHGLMLVLPTDHVVADGPALCQAISYAVDLCAAGHLVTFGATASRAETGYGYIRKGEVLDAAPNAFCIDQFVEKPDQELAASMVKSGEFLWNSGMFLFSAGHYLQELRRHHPLIVQAAKSAMSRAKRDELEVDPLAAPLEDVESQSIDYGVMEHTRAGAVVEIDMGWSDVGSWRAVWEHSSKDEHGTAVVGNVTTLDTTDCYVQSCGRLVTTVGVDNLIVVDTEDALLVTTTEHAQQVKQLVEMLNGEQTGQTKLVQRPWGTYQSVHCGPGFQVKHITVDPGERLSTQYHHHRSEHWVVVSGTAEVLVGERVQVLEANQSVHIPLGAVHRLSNWGEHPVHLIEVQYGSYLGEDDIVRLDDDYGRIGSDVVDDRRCMAAAG